MSTFSVYPAIELRGGMGLRYENLGMGTRANRVDAVKLAKEYEKAGAPLIHLVNLDGPFWWAKASTRAACWPGRTRTWKSLPRLPRP